MGRLTRARREALEWFRDNDGAKFFPIGTSGRVRRALVDDGLLREERPPFGMVATFITDLGRSALAQSEEKK